MSSGRHGISAQTGGSAPGSRRALGGTPDKKPTPLMDPTRQREGHRILALFRPYRVRLSVVLLMIVGCILVAELIAHIAEQRRTSERELRFLADNTSDLVLRCSLDGVVLYASPSAQRMLGRRPEQLRRHIGLEF